MPTSNDFGARDRTHVSIDAFREQADYEVPGRRQSRKPLRDDYAAHADTLMAQLTAALASTPAAPDRLAVEGLKPGTVVEVATAPPAEGSRKAAVKVPASLDFPTQDIVVLRGNRRDDRSESALVFIPDDARVFLESRIASYGSRDIGNRPRPDVEKFEAIETINAVAARNLFTGRIDFDEPSRRWWELWIREPKSPERMISDQVGRYAATSGFDVHADRLLFPETTVIFIHAAGSALAGFVARIQGAVSEIRPATGTIAPFLTRGDDMDEVDQQDWVDDLAARVMAPVAGAPAVCTLDTGVAAAHPLLQLGLAGAWAYDAAWGTDDHEPHGGHGTALASTALLGDLFPLVQDNRQVALTHNVESMKLLPPNGFPATEPGNYGSVTQGAVASVEIERPGISRSYCLACSTVDFPNDRPSTWSGAIDQIAAGAMPGDRKPELNAAQHPKRLVVLPTGNVQGGMRDQVEPCQPLEDPSQSWNALTTGGYTTKETCSNGLTPVVPANHRSPYSRGSNLQANDLTPIKPEVLFEAGNMAADSSDFCAWHPDLSLLAAGSEVTAEPLVPFWATSAAAGMAGHFAGQLQAALPERWPETHRALIVDSAAWPEPIRKRLIGRGAHWRSLSKAQLQAVLREVGYGVPRIDRAMLSARNDMTMIAEAEIQPFTLGADGRSAIFNEMHLYKLPWPKRALEQIENDSVIMKVTLSYFIEPNLSGRAATRPETYRSFGLRFAMKKRGEPSTTFRSRISAAQERDGVESPDEKSCWLLGPKAVQAGSLHCDLWRGRAIDLALHDEIAVYPVGGWWKSHVGQRRMRDKGRYALIISLSAPGHAVDLHAEVVSLIEAASVTVGSS